jgi:hypothetical protein
VIYARQWTFEKYRKFEDNAKWDDLVLGDNSGEIGFYTPTDWNEKRGMSFSAWVQRRFLE